MSTPAVPPVTPEAPGLSEGARLVNVFMAPSSTFSDLQRNASWWVPWLIMSIVTLIFVGVMQKQIGFDRIVRTQISKNAAAQDRFDKMPPDQKERQIALQVTITRYLSYASPIMLLISFAVISAILMALFNFGLGAEVPYGRSFAITVYAFLPSLIASILGIVVMFIADPDGFDVQNPVATNLGAVIDQSHKFLRTFLTGIDIFNIWIMVLLAIGFSSNSKVKRGTAFATIFGSFLVWKLVTAGFAAMF